MGGNGSFREGIAGRGGLKVETPQPLPTLSQALTYIVISRKKARVMAKAAHYLP